MDQRTLVVSCVEYYSKLKNIPSNNVFTSFEKAGFIQMIVDSQKMFPEMGHDFYIGMVDGLTFLESDANTEEAEYTHAEERTALVDAVVAMLQKKHKMNDMEACEMYYHSETAGSVSNEKTGYYLKSAQEIYDLIEAE